MNEKNDDGSRRAFEEWFEADAMPLEHSNWFRLDADGDYSLPRVQGCWEGWEAAWATDRGSRRLEFLIKHAYTQRGTDGVDYWVCPIFPVGGFDTFQESIDAEISRENI